jgi:hypothetical protein
VARDSAATAYHFSGKPAAIELARPPCEDISNNEDMSNKVRPMCGAIAEGMDAATVAARWQQLQPQENIDYHIIIVQPNRIESMFGIGARSVSY